MLDYSLSLRTLSGKPSSLSAYRGEVLLIVNVASECGLTPQYTGLQKLQERFGGRGLRVLGFPCNQFGGQEPGAAEVIQAFCSREYGVTFPLFEKVEVNGPGRHPLYEVLTRVTDASGAAGDVAWNFEKFLVDRQGAIQRFRPRTAPEDSELVEAIEAALLRA